MRHWWNPHATSGWFSGAVLAMGLLTGLAWISWPVWSSLTAPDRATLIALTPSLLVAQCGFLMLLAWATWRDSHHRTWVFAPIMIALLGATATRVLLQPNQAGIEPALAIPLLTGAALGAPAGFLIGAGAAMVSSMALGLVDVPLVGQVVVWGLWGACGGIFRHTRPVPAWLGCALSPVALAMVSGLLLNASGWSSQREASVGAFLPGLDPWTSLVRLIQYTLATSWAVDAMRAASTALVILTVGHPILTAVRESAGTAVPPLRCSPRRRDPEITPQSIEHRRRSHLVSTLWPTPEGPDDDPNNT